MLHIAHFMFHINCSLNEHNQILKIALYLWSVYLSALQEEITTNKISLPENINVKFNVLKFYCVLEFINIADSKDFDEKI